MLSVELHSLLTADRIELLKKHNVKTLLDFVQCGNEKLASVIIAPVGDVIKIKETILSTYGSKALRGSKVYQDHLRNTLVLDTGIAEIDNLLGGRLSSGTITEIFGHSNSGKTQIALHFSAHSALHSHQTIAFLSSNELHSSRLYEIIQNINHEGNCLEALQKIQFGHVSGVFELLDALWQINTGHFKIVIIDSIASLFMPIWGDSHNDAISLLNKVASDLKRLAVLNRCTILVINHVSSWQKDCPALGRYWVHVPHLRLQTQRLDNNQFQLNVVHDVYNPGSNDQCSFVLPQKKSCQTSEICDKTR